MSYANHHPDSDATDAGAAQFVTNLSPEQLQHLQYSIPRNDQPQRYSQFLENPRPTPIANRFTVDLAALTARNIEEAEREAKAAEKEGSKHSRTASGKSTNSTTKSSNSTKSKASILSFPSRTEIIKAVEDVVSENWRFYVTGSCICMLNLLAAWDVTSLPMALPAIAQALQVTTLNCLWLGIEFFLVATCFVPLSVDFSEAFGRKAVVLAALTIFAIGSIISAASENITEMHVGRVVQGIGAGGIYALSKIILTDLVSAFDRWKWNAILGATWAVGIVTGPAIAGSLAETGQWRWIYWINLPFCVLVSILLALFAQLKPATADSVLLKLRNIDWLGYVLFVGSLASLFIGLEWAGTVYTWSSFPVTLPVLFGISGLLVTLVWSWFSPFPPVVSMRRFLTITNLATYFGSLVLGIIVYALLYFMPLYLSIVYSDYNQVEIAVSLFACSMPLVLAAFVAFVVASKTRFLIPQIWFAWFVLLITIALMLLFARDSSTATWVCLAVVSGSGIGILYASLSAASTLSVRAIEKGDGVSDDLQHATTNLVFFQTLGQALGIAFGGTIFQNELFQNYRKLDLSALHATKNALNLLDDIRGMTADNATFKSQITDAYVNALSPLWILLTILASLALVASLFMNNGCGKQDSEKKLKLKNLNSGIMV